MRFLRAAILSLCLIFATQASAVNKNHERAQKATLVLYGHSEQRDVTVPLCTVFVYEKSTDGYFLLTAGHCFDDAPEDATYYVADRVIENPQVKQLEVVDVLRHVDDGKMDAAELHLKTKKVYEVLELENTPTKVDDKVFYVGYPEMLTQVTYVGRVASNPIEVVGSIGGQECDICKGRILIQDGGGPGASGSPIISEKTGKVVGILEGHVFENGIVVVPTPALNIYLSQKIQPKTAVEKPSFLERREED
jgi:hypothetical protein